MHIRNTKSFLLLHFLIYPFILTLTKLDSKSIKSYWKQLALNPQARSRDVCWHSDRSAPRQACWDPGAAQSRFHVPSATALATGPHGQAAVRRAQPAGSRTRRDGRALPSPSAAPAKGAEGGDGHAIIVADSHGATAREPCTAI